jgi:hypothetical protein
VKRIADELHLKNKPSGIISEPRSMKMVKSYLNIFNQGQMAGIVNLEDDTILNVAMRIIEESTHAYDGSELIR